MSKASDALMRQRAWRNYGAAVAVAMLLLVAGSEVINMRAKAAEQAAVAERAARREQARKAKESDYASQRDTLLAEARAAMDRRAYDDVIRVAQPWQDVGEPELRALFKVAQREAKAAQEAAAAKAAREAAEARERLLAAAEAKESARKVVESRIGPMPHRSGWDGTYREVEDYLARVAHDPDSVKIEPCTQVRETPEGWALACRWRARNAFGAMRVQDTMFMIRHGRVVSAD
jgi:hypothetical protein